MSDAATVAYQLGLYDGTKRALGKSLLTWYSFEPGDGPEIIVALADATDDSSVCMLVAGADGWVGFDTSGKVIPYGSLLQHIELWWPVPLPRVRTRETKPVADKGDICGVAGCPGILRLDLRGCVCDILSAPCPICRSAKPKCFLCGRIAVYEPQTQAHTSAESAAQVGEALDEVCGVDGCTGTLRSIQEGCSCHINPPCQSCVEASLECDKCYREICYSEI